MDKKLHLVVATAIIARKRPALKDNHSGETEYLILKRAPHEKAYPNRWTVPGGKLKKEEYIDTPKTTKDAWYYALDKSLRREIREEANLEVGDLRYLLDLVFIRPDDIPVVTLSFWGEYKSGKTELSEDHTDYFWGTVEELKDYDLIEGIYDEIRMVDNLIDEKTINDGIEGI
ncbi:MAG: NUDIX domain-containing protein [Candidatus Portnoybacteria bacterium]|nr:NUDIX domain-containing protein [Candidatus Portnoybacteria bacterium]